MKTRIGLFPGSFDPFTNGHQDIVEQALRIVDKLVVAVGVSSSKAKAALTNEQRLEAINLLYEAQDRVEVISFKGLAVEAAKSVGAHYLVRGLRNENDFSYELPMALTNRDLNPSIQTIFFPTQAGLSYVSSSLVKEVLKNGGDIKAFVPQKIYDYMKANALII